MAKRKRTKGETTQKTNDRAMRTPLTIGLNSCVLERLAVTSLLKTPQ